jgi:transposase
MKLEVAINQPSSEEAHMGSYVGIDLHRRRSVIVVLNEDGNRVSWSRIDNTPANLAAEVVAAGGPAAEVAMEATWGWYWAADVIAECGATLHLAHPLGIAGYENRRVKNDIRDATLLADLLRMGRLPESWVAPPEVRELREVVRYRHKLARLRAGLKAQVHQTLGKEGVIPQLDSIWGPGGRQWLNELRLGDEYVNRIESLRDLIEGYDREVHDCDVRIYRRLKGHPGYEAVRGVGPVLAAVFVAEVGDVGRFVNARQLSSWAGLTPRHRESDAHTQRGRITKQGSRLLRWAAVEAVSGAVRDPQIASIKARVGARRGRNIGRVAAARQLLTLVYYGLRDGEIRCLANAA